MSLSKNEEKWVIEHIKRFGKYDNRNYHSVVGSTYSRVKHPLDAWTYNTYGAAKNASFRILTGPWYDVRVVRLDIALQEIQDVTE